MVPAPPGITQAASLDIIKAYRYYRITPDHRRYIALSQKSAIQADHCAAFGLATAKNILTQWSIVFHSSSNGETWYFYDLAYILDVILGELVPVDMTCPFHSH